MLRNMPAHFWQVKRVRAREHSHVLGCELLRGIGYSWSCRCGERGAIFDTRGAARLDAIKHATNLGKPRVTVDDAGGVER